MAEFAKDIIIHLNRIQEDQNILQKLSYEYFCRMDSDGSGSINAKELVKVFGHSNFRVDSDQTQILFSGEPMPSSIDKYDFHR